MADKIRSLADINARNRDFYRAPPLIERRPDGSIVDAKFTHRPEVSSKDGK